MVRLGGGGAVGVPSIEFATAHVLLFVVVVCAATIDVIQCSFKIGLLEEKSRSNTQGKTCGDGGFFYHRAARGVNNLDRLRR